MTESEQEHHSHHKPETIPPCPKAANYHWVIIIIINKINQIIDGNENSTNTRLR